MMCQSSFPLIPSVLLVIVVSYPTITTAQDRCTTATQNSDTGGSCTFRRNLCEWSNHEGNQFNWAQAKGRTYLSLNMTRMEAGSQAKLISPLLCATGSERHSFRFRFYLGDADKCRLSLYLVDPGEEPRSSRRILWTSTEADPGGFLSVDDVSFSCPNSNFQVMFVGEKLSNRFQSCGQFNVIAVSNVVYRNTHIIDVSLEVDKCSAPRTASTTTFITVMMSTMTTMMIQTSAASGTEVNPESSGNTTGTGNMGPEHSENEDDEDEERGLSIGAIAGIVVVVVIVVIVIVLIVVFLYVRRRKTGRWSWKGSLPTVVKIRRSVTHRTHYMLGAQRNPQIAHQQNHHQRHSHQVLNADVMAQPSAPPPPPSPLSSPLYSNLTPTTTTSSPSAPTSPTAGISRESDYANESGGDYANDETYANERGGNYDNNEMYANESGGDYANDEIYANESGGDYANEKTYAHEREGDSACEGLKACEREAEGTSGYTNFAMEDQYCVARPVSAQEEESTGADSCCLSSLRFSSPSAAVNAAAAADCEYSLAEHVSHMNVHPGTVEGVSRAEQDGSRDSAVTQLTAFDDDNQYCMAQHICDKGNKVSAQGGSQTMDGPQTVYSVAQTATPNLSVDATQNAGVNGHGDISNRRNVERFTLLTPQTEIGLTADYVNVKKSAGTLALGEWSKGDGYSRLELTQHNISSAMGTGNSGKVQDYNGGRHDGRYDRLKLKNSPTQ